MTSHDTFHHLTFSRILSLLFNSSSYSSSELEEFFHATEVLNSNHRQYSIDALNATQHSSNKSDREKNSSDWSKPDENSMLIPPDPSECRDPRSLVNSKGSSKTSSTACKSTTSNAMSSKVTTTTAAAAAHTLNTESGSGITLGNSNAHSSSSSSQNAKNIHLNPFYELSRMTAADLRNYRYNSGLEEDDSW